MDKLFPVVLKELLMLAAPSFILTQYTDWVLKICCCGILKRAVVSFLHPGMATMHLFLGCASFSQVAQPINPMIFLSLSSVVSTFDKLIVHHLRSNKRCLSQLPISCPAVAQQLSSSSSAVAQQWLSSYSTVANQLLSSCSAVCLAVAQQQLNRCSAEAQQLLSSCSRIAQQFLENC